MLGPNLIVPTIRSKPRAYDKFVRLMMVTCATLLLACDILKIKRQNNNIIKIRPHFQNTHYLHCLLLVVSVSCIFIRNLAVCTHTKNHIENVAHSGILNNLSHIRKNILTDFPNLYFTHLDCLFANCTLHNWIAMTNFDKNRNDKDDPVKPPNIRKTVTTLHTHCEESVRPLSHPTLCGERD